MTDFSGLALLSELLSDGLGFWLWERCNLLSLLNGALGFMLAAKDMHSFYVIFKFTSWTFWLVPLIINQCCKYFVHQISLHGCLFSIESSLKAIPTSNISFLCLVLHQFCNKCFFYENYPLSCVCCMLLFVHRKHRVWALGKPFPMLHHAKLHQQWARRIFGEAKVWTSQTEVSWEEQWPLPVSPGKQP